MTLSWGLLAKIVAGVGLPILAIFTVWLSISKAVDRSYAAGRADERAAQQTNVAKETSNRAAERVADNQRVTEAVEGYANRAAALRPIIAHSTEVVHDYAQTDAGRAPCLGIDRVRGIEATAAALGLLTASSADGGKTIMFSPAAAGSGSH